MKTRHLFLAEQQAGRGSFEEVEEDQNGKRKLKGFSTSAPSNNPTEV